MDLSQGSGVSSVLMYSTWGHTKFKSITVKI